jgi:ATP-dependent Clp protease ATP-binding subunit ClpA
MLDANEGLENIFENAVKEAEKRNHEYVTIEHLLLALIKDKNVGTVLHDFKVNVSALIRDVETYLNDKCGDIVFKGDGKFTPRKTASLERLMNRAFTQALFQGRQDVTALDVLLSIFAEKKSHAAYFLSKIF